ncbi:MAG: alpha-2-macroglobulin family protein, partial [Maritimibacter sp.]
GFRPDVPMLNLDARYLFGAPGAGLAVEGDLRLQQAREVAAWPGYRFGRYDDQMSVQWGELPSATTDDSGHAAILPELPSVKATGVPLTARATVRVKEGSGRPVERSLTADILPSGPMIGIKPGFEDDVRENSEATFSLIALTPDLKARNMDVTWELNRVRTRYQWYRIDGSWNWDPVTTRERVSTGTAHLGESPAPVAAQVDWGRYELVVTETGGTLSSSVDFYAGWYVPADTISTPDMLEVSLDAESYTPGDTATLRFVPRTAGKALISVMSNRLIDMITVNAVAGENTVTLPVTEDWGAGAYVTATLIQPLDGLEGHTPTRALGLSYAAVDPGPHQLTARFDVAAEAAPRGPLEVVLNVDGIVEGETAYATIAAVDVGILNLTSFQSPDPSDHYFGQRRLGMGIRDLYGRLIDGRSGEMGALRSGGDAMAGMRMQAPPPTEELMAQFSGPITVVDGKTVAQFDLPEFNGTVRLMAVVWSKTGLGNASEDVLVRDPVVMTATLPRFLAPGDDARMLLELTHATGPTGEVQISASSDAITDGRYETSVMLGDGETARLSVPITAPDVGLHQVKLLLATPDGTELTKTLNLPVELLDPEVSTTTRLSLAPGESFTLTDDLVAGLSAPHVSLTAGPLARLDAAGLITMLDRYPYGCTEQQTSRALPLLYLGGLAQAMGIAGPEDVTDRIAKTITGVLANQAASGSFGLWRPDSGDLWLDAYVTDFLSRARAEGYQVPDTAFRSALDNLRNQVNYYPDFEKGGSDLAYALYVLAREGAAAMGDLRYYADVKPEAFTTPLGSAQIGGALAAYGDQQRADRMFAQASRQLADEAGKQQGWRDDYGTDLRDAAGILALAAEAGSNAVDRTAILSQLARSGSYLSTQEATWSLLAARALIGETAEAGLKLDGNALTDPMLSFANAGALAAPHVIENGGDAAMDLTITSYGVPDVPPAAEGNGYNIQRRYFTMEGDPVDIAEVAQGTRLVTLISVTPWTSTRARLMINDPLPAGFEIDNPNLLRAGDIRALDWLDVTTRTETTEFRQDRFLAAVNWGSKDTIRLAYIVRAVTPGSFRHPAASVEDMYRPTMRAHGEAGRVVVTAE